MGTLAWLYVAGLVVLSIGTILHADRFHMNVAYAVAAHILWPLAVPAVIAYAIYVRVRPRLTPSAEPRIPRP